jgi:hypothetical protein
LDRKGVKKGLGQHIQAIGRDTSFIYHDIYLGLWILNHFYSLALALAKLSILSFYWRVFKSTSIKLPIKVVATLVVCWFLVRVSISYGSSLVSTQADAPTRF